MGHTVGEMEPGWQPLGGMPTRTIPVDHPALVALIAAVRDMEAALNGSVPGNATSPLVWHVRNTITAAAAVPIREETT